jgi:hypothetical protein
MVPTKIYSMGEYAQLSIVGRSNNFKRNIAPRLAAFEVPNIFLWGYIKDNAYHNNPCNLN